MNRAEFVADAETLLAFPEAPDLEKAARLVATCEREFFHDGVARDLAARLAQNCASSAIAVAGIGSLSWLYRAYQLAMTAAVRSDIEVSLVEELCRAGKKDEALAHAKRLLVEIDHQAPDLRKRLVAIAKEALSLPIDE